MIINDQEGAEAEFRKWLISNSIKHNSRVNLSQISWLKTGGIAKIIIFPQNAIELQSIIKACSELGVEFKIMGNTSNLLFLDNRTYGTLIKTTEMDNVEVVNCNEYTLINAEAGAQIVSIARVALNEGVSGMEGMEGIPATIGGAIFMNAGAYGSEISFILHSVTAISKKGEIKLYERQELNMSRRRSIFMENGDVILEACLKLKKSDRELIYSKMELCHAKRHRYQEFIFPTLGTMFKTDLYRALAKKDLLFFLYFSLFYLLNYKLKICRTESPINRIDLNEFFRKRCKLNAPRRNYSAKYINCLTNRGQGTGEMVDFISELQEIFGNALELENEIVEPLDGLDDFDASRLRTLRARNNE